MYAQITVINLKFMLTTHDTVPRYCRIANAARHRKNRSLPYPTDFLLTQTRWFRYLEWMSNHEFHVILVKISRDCNIQSTNAVSGNELGQFAF